MSPLAGDSRSRLASASACTQVHVQTPAWPGIRRSAVRRQQRRSQRWRRPCAPPALDHERGDGHVHGSKDLRALRHRRRADSQACEACIAHRTNCFIEKSTCSAATPRPSTRVTMQENSQMCPHRCSPATYSVAVLLPCAGHGRRADVSGRFRSCECDATWEQPPQVRLCALSNHTLPAPAHRDGRAVQRKHRQVLHLPGAIDRNAATIRLC